MIQLESWQIVSGIFFTLVSALGAVYSIKRSISADKKAILSSENKQSIDKLELTQTSLLELNKILEKSIDRMNLQIVQLQKEKIHDRKLLEDCLIARGELGKQFEALRSRIEVTHEDTSRALTDIKNGNGK